MARVARLFYSSPVSDRIRRRRADDGGDICTRVSAAEFRAATEERLLSVKRELDRWVERFYARIKARVDAR